MSEGGVVDVGDVHEVGSVADLDELSCPGAGDDAWEEVRVAGSEDEVGAEGDGAE